MATKMAFALLAFSVLIFPEWPAVALLTGAGAFLWASVREPSLGQGLELVVFYGAVAGVLIAFLS